LIGFTGGTKPAIACCGEAHNLSNKWKPESISPPGKLPARISRRNCPAGEARIAGRKTLYLKAPQQMSGFRPRNEKVRLYTSYAKWSLKFMLKISDNVPLINQ
jgi:hypothetical protein